MYDNEQRERRDDEMFIEDRFYDQSWVQELSNDDFRMLHYLMHFASKKCGIVELNMRMLNFAANTGRLYTQDEILQRFSNMLCLIPGKKLTAIFPNWIATNWAKNGKPIDTERNPLFKSVVQELASYGLTIAKVNKMAKIKVVVIGQEDEDDDDGGEPERESSDGDMLVLDSVSASEQTVKEDYEAEFETFWKEYPGPRKVDKKKCREKFIAYRKKGVDFKTIMDGLDTWKRSAQWKSDGGAFIRAPLVWLNRENWNDKPEEGNGNTKKPDGSIHYKSKNTKGLW